MTITTNLTELHGDSYSSNLINFCDCTALLRSFFPV